MKKLNNNITTIVLFFGIMLIQGSVVFAQTKTMTYSIDAWNVSGSYTFNMGTVLNPVTNQVEGYIRINFPDSSVVEITPEAINTLIQKLENPLPQMLSGITTPIPDSGMVAIELGKLRSVKSLLEDEDRMKTFINQFQNSSLTSDLNWSYTLQTIRYLQVQVSGTLH